MSERSANSTSKVELAPEARTRQERDFLHHLSTPLTVALMQSDHLIDVIQVEGKTLERMEKIRTALQKMASLLNERREILIQRTDQEQKNK